MKCMFFHKDCNCLEERTGCPHAKNTEHVVNVVNYMLEIAGLPSYSLLQRSCEEATKFVLSITREPRTAQLGEQRKCNGECGYIHSPWEKCHTSSTEDIKKTALTLLRPQPNENISQWAERYVSAMLSE